jgi:hypothetical protein
MGDEAALDDALEVERPRAPSDCRDPVEKDRLRGVPPCAGSTCERPRAAGGYNDEGDAKAELVLFNCDRGSADAEAMMASMAGDGVREWLFDCDRSLVVRDVDLDGRSSIPPPLPLPTTNCRFLLT